MILRWFRPAALALFVLVVGALYVHVPPNPDQSIFDYAGWIGAQGGRYYVDSAEQNFPGAMFLHELAHRIFGNHIWTFRAMDFVLVLAGAAALFDLLRRAGHPRAAWICVPVYVLEYCASGQWMSGQRDLIGANVLLIGCHCVVRRLSGGSVAWVFGVAAALFAATLLRPTYLLFAAVLLAADILVRGATGRTPLTIASDAIRITVAILAGAAAVIAWGASVGSLTDWYVQSIRFNLEAYSVDTSTWTLLVGNSGLVARFSVLIALGAVGFARLWKHVGARPVAGLLGGLIITSIVSTLVQGKGYPYHLGAIIPASCALASVGLDGLYDRARQAPRSAWRVTAFAVSAAVALFSSAWHARMLGPQIRHLAGVDDRREMLARATTGVAAFDWNDLETAVEYVRRNVPPDESVLVWSRAVSINVLAERRSPTRFITFGMIAQARPPFCHAEAWMSEFKEAFRSRAPRLIFAPGWHRAGDFDDLWLAGDPDTAAGFLRAQLEARYEVVAQFGSQAVYRLKE